MEPSVIIAFGYYGHLSPLYQNVLIFLCLKELGCITPLVLLPSERLSGSGVGAYNRPTLVDDSPSGSG